jgi:hypothetical protein
MFVEPSKEKADILVTSGDDWQTVIMAIKRLLEAAGHGSD